MVRRTFGRTSRQPRLESLENRLLMAGDVKVGFDTDARDLIINGDGNSNQILVEEVAVDRIRITGQDGTRINGRTTPVTVTVTDDLTINMNGGSDRVTLRNLNQDNFDHSDVNINLGTGNDTLDIIAVDVARHLNVQAGDGNDDIAVEETNTGDIDIDGEYGRDDIRVEQSFARFDLIVDGGEDSDDIELVDSKANDDVYVYGDSGNDDIVVANLDVRDYVRVDAGTGDDNVFVSNSEAEDISVFGRSGDDVVALYDNKVFDQLYANLSTGQDDLYFGGNRMSRHYFNAGTGIDHWHSVEFWVTWSNFYDFE